MNQKKIKDIFEVKYFEATEIANVEYRELLNNRLKEFKLQIDLQFQT